FLVVRSETRHLICMCKIFWPKFSICDLICHVYILFEPLYNILHNKIQIWTFDSDNRIDLLWEFNYILGFFIQTDLTFNSNSFTKSFQHLTSQKILLCLQCEDPPKPTKMYHPELTRFTWIFLPATGQL